MTKLSMIKKSLMGLLAIGAMASFTGCETSTSVVITDPAVYAWYDLYGNGCSTGNPRPGCNYYWYNGQLVKIMDFEDPYYTSTYYNLVYDYYTYYLNGVLYEFTGYAWVSPTGVIYDEYGNALNQKKSRSRDIVGDVAKTQNKIVTKAGKEFAAKYSLSEKKGIEIARALNDWANIKRQRTDKDMSELSQRLYGIDATQVKSAILEAQKGNKELMKKTISEAAANWGTSEENMKDVLKTWYKGAAIVD